MTAPRVTPLDPPRKEEIHAARERIRGLAVRTPLLRLPLEDAEIHLKLETLQPIGSFKIRGAGNAMRSAPRDLLARGVYTASAGNMAQGVAWCAREMGIRCTAVVPDDAPRAKLDAIERLGARTLLVPFADWWTVLEEHRYPGLDGLFVHPVADPAVIAGNGTIGLEILEDLPDVDAVLVPFGGGGLSGGIASAIRAERPGVPVYACEIETAAPLAASWASGVPSSVDRIPSFVDGIGGKSVLPEMWALLRSVLQGPIVVSLEETAAAVRLLVARARVVAEGAGAVSVAAALAGRAGRGRLACVVSGGNIDPQKLATILMGRLP
ncbi:MAG TPA: pyridoxal-phosphate dependent enzyme [Candidatus Eisenbacteria bacterium]|nr:pyridoxal-phosphate dependent enzyme [Candidatus Eisenbacteria bacterium]